MAITVVFSVKPINAGAMPNLELRMTLSKTIILCHARLARYGVCIFKRHLSPKANWSGEGAGPSLMWRSIFGGAARVLANGSATRSRPKMVISSMCPLDSPTGLSPWNPIARLCINAPTTMPPKPKARCVGTVVASTGPYRAIRS